jgi:hypothetical protein
MGKDFYKQFSDGGMIISFSSLVLVQPSFLIRLQPNETLLHFVYALPDLPIVGIYPR